MFAVIYHSGEAMNKGLGLRDTKLVIFGSPTAGSPVVVATPGAVAARYRVSNDLTDRPAGTDALTDGAIKV
jgi:hypothetical protein